MKTIPAIYENGIFRPQGAVALPSGALVDVILPDVPADPVAHLRARFPNSFGGLPEKDASEMMAAIEEEFGRIESDGHAHFNTVDGLRGVSW